MPATDYAGSTVEINEEGFLVDSDQWSPEIADELYISLSTVKTHLASLMQKLGARNRVEIAMWAHETGRMKP